ncbi:putative 23S rRNA methyltransferase [Megalodesulfovibrio gigas DSM 1382 = ATCC 19364]|uniref:Probable dual-specificity RNA methyltransferase RlmN n=2 Tax=Megalodesulfovibrio gigas TaxID=879 RepID=T2GB43_MEGG1|nr:putative 23S rRNA methyltransferase [Megalodesulfovibrio gigas DSM 1382 = ATCC 19364]
MVKMSLLSLPLPALEQYCASLGEPGFRAKQLFQWIWEKGVVDVSAMTNLSKAFREKLLAGCSCALPEVVTTQASKDGTLKLLLALEDGERVETVLIPEKDHTTQCLSTQVGCAMGCTFCATGTLGFTRNMTAGEMAGQVLAARQVLAERGIALPLRNLVFMGMGEPLLNYDNLLDTLHILTHPLGPDFSTRRVTVSTVGIKRGLVELGETGLCSLAVSLHAPTQALREQLMPRAAKALPLEELLALLEAYPLKARQRITLEYVLLGGVNDQPQHARELVRLFAHFKGSSPKINLICYNPPQGVDSPYAAPQEADVAEFMAILQKKGMTVLRRASKGADIAAACGQLKAQEG